MTLEEVRALALQSALRTAESCGQEMTRNALHPYAGSGRTTEAMTEEVLTTAKKYFAWLTNQEKISE